METDYIHNNFKLAVKTKLSYSAELVDKDFLRQWSKVSALAADNRKAHALQVVSLGFGLIVE